MKHVNTNTSRFPIIKLGKNLGRNEKTHVGIPRLDIGIPTLEFQCPIVGSLASEFLGWSWNSYVGIPMLDIGIPTSEFQLQCRNSEAREPTNGY